MDQFNFKQWLMENRAGAYSKVSLNEALDPNKAFADDNTNRGDLQEIDPAALGVGQAVADREMQKQDDLNSDWVDNASMGVVAEAGEKSTTVNIKDWEVNILGKDHIIDAEVDVDFHSEDDEYVDHMIVSPGGIYIDNAVAKITKLGVENGDEYRDVNDPAYIKQIEELINKDPKLNRKLEDEAADSPDFQNVMNDDGYDSGYEPDEMDETVGWAMITKPADPGHE